jgi:hypothetical protein
MRLGRASALTAIAALMLWSAIGMAAKQEDVPPQAWGALAKPRFGCPKIAGVYAWPPASHPEPEPGQAGRMPFRNIAGLPLHSPSYLWLFQPDQKKHLWIKTLAIPRGNEVIGFNNRGWRSIKLANSQHHCDRGWLIIDEHESSDPGANAAHAGSVLLLFRLVPLANGSLAIGRMTRVSGRGNALYWADAKIIDLPSGALETWHWARLERVADSGDQVGVTYR